MSVYAEDCNDRQILNDGECQDCPTWTRAQDGNSYCNSDKCDHVTQVVTTDGTCKSCPEGYEPDVNMVDCNKIGLTCEGNTAKNGDRCVECPEYTRPQSDNSFCSPDYCDQNSITLPTGECQACEDGTKPDLIWRRECVVDKRNQVCNDRQIELKDHAGLTTCQDCPEYTRAQEQNWYCGADFCDFNQIVLKDGSCLSCPRTETPDASRMKCKPMPTGFVDEVPAASEVQEAPQAQQTETVQSSTTCEPSWQIQLADGTCVACPEFTRPQANGECAADLCSRNEFLHEWGYCLPCPEGRLHDRTGRRCETQGGLLLANFEPIQCKERQHRSIDGLACYDCPDYTRAQDNNARCGGDECEIFEIQNVDGTCSSCPEGRRPNFKKRNCVEIVSHLTCTHRQIYVEVMNMCEECPNYTRPRGDYCEADKCGDNQRVQLDGTCSAIQCGELEILGQDGVTCEQCFPYTRPQDNGSRCGQDDCPRGIIQFDGTCMAYGEYYTNLKVVKNPQEEGLQIVEEKEESSSASVVVIGVLSVVIIGLVGFIVYKSRAGEKPQQSHNDQNVVEAAQIQQKAVEQQENGPTGKKLVVDQSFENIDAEVPEEKVEEDSMKAPIAVNE